VPAPSAQPAESRWQFVLDDSLGLFIQAPPSLAGSLDLRIDCDSLPGVLQHQRIQQDDAGNYRAQNSNSTLTAIRGERWVTLHGRRTANQPLLVGFVRRPDNCWLTVGVNQLDKAATPETMSRMLQSVRFREEDAR
jgi:hypothetical protein